MGWWSTTVMGGDTPADIMCELEVAAGTTSSFFDRFEDGDLSPEVRKEVRNAIIKNLVKIFNCAKKIAKQDKDTDDVGIAAQVLGVFLIENGVKMSKDIKKFVLAGIKADLWANSDEDRMDSRARRDVLERKAHMAAFYEQVKAFRGKAAEVAYEGLFDKITEHLSEGKSGLANK